MSNARFIFSGRDVETRFSNGKWINRRAGSDAVASEHPDLESASSHGMEKARREGVEWRQYDRLGRLVFRAMYP